MRKNILILMLFVFLSCLGLWSTQATAEDCPGYTRRHYEIHYGFTNDIVYNQNAVPITVSVSLTPSYQKTTCTGSYCVALHPISELMLDSGESSQWALPGCNSTTGRDKYYTSTSWTTTTGYNGDAWDGMGFVFAFPDNEGNASFLTITIDVLQSGQTIWQRTYIYSADDLDMLFPQIDYVDRNAGNPPMRFTVSSQGHIVEFGAFHTLRWRIYDYKLMWGYGEFTHHEESCLNPYQPVGDTFSGLFKARLWFNGGYLRYLYSNRQSGDTITDCQGNPIVAGSISRNICFESQLSDDNTGNYIWEDEHTINNGNPQGFNINLIVPTYEVYNDTAELSLSAWLDSYKLIDGTLGLKENEDPNTEESTGGKYKIPWHWQSMDAQFRCADTLHFVHAHEHWCWWKAEY